MKIEFSNHSLIKIEILKSHGFKISKEMVKDIIKAPDKMYKGYKDRLIAQKIYDKEHILRVVHEPFPTKFYVITIYPARRTRYEKD